jgi:hypothetical protein
MKTSSLIRGSVVAAIFLLAIGVAFPSSATAAPTGKKYATPETATDAFVGAMRSYNL